MTKKENARELEIASNFLAHVHYWLDRADEQAEKLKQSVTRPAEWKTAYEFKSIYLAKARAIYLLGIDLGVFHKGDFPTIDYH